MNNMTVKNIMDLPACTRINGKKCITVSGIWANVVYADGEAIYKYNKEKGEWHMYNFITCTTF